MFRVKDSHTAVWTWQVNLWLDWRWCRRTVSGSRSASSRAPNGKGEKLSCKKHKINWVIYIRPEVTCIYWLRFPMLSYSLPLVGRSGSGGKGGWTRLSGEKMAVSDSRKCFVCYYPHQVSRSATNLQLMSNIYLTIDQLEWHIFTFQTISKHLSCSLTPHNVQQSNELMAWNS